MSNLVTKQDVRDLRVLIDKALAQVAKENGWKSITADNASFDPEHGNVKFQLRAVIAGGKTEQEARYEVNAPFMGLPPLGTKMLFDGQDITITGMNKTATKVLVSLEDGRVGEIKVEGLRREWVVQNESKTK